MGLPIEVRVSPTVPPGTAIIYTTRIDPVTGQPALVYLGRIINIKEGPAHD